MLNIAQGWSAEILCLKLVSLGITAFVIVCQRFAEPTLYGDTKFKPYHVELQIKKLYFHLVAGHRKRARWHGPERLTRDCCGLRGGWRWGGHRTLIRPTYESGHCSGLPWEGPHGQNWWWHWWVLSLILCLHSGAAYDLQKCKLTIDVSTTDFKVSENSVNRRCYCSLQAAYINIYYKIYFLILFIKKKRWKPPKILSKNLVPNVD